MMYTSNEANKLLKQYKEELSRETFNEGQSCTYVLSIDEDERGNTPEYDFATTNDRVYALNGKIRKIKHAINVFNTTTEVDGFDMTIDELLVALPMWNSRLSTLKTMGNRLPKRRISSSKFIEYEYVNYDTNEVKKSCDVLADIIRRAQTALDTINNTKKFEIDF